MTGLDLSYVIKDEMQRVSEEISRLTRRRAILQGALTKLRLSWKPAVVLAELEASGETVPIPAEEAQR